MSFIERREAERAAQQRAAVEAQKRAEQARAQQAQEAANRAAAETARQQQLKQQASRHLQNSGAANMAARLASTIKGAHFSTSDNGTAQITWDHHGGLKGSDGRYDYEDRTLKMIEIEAHSDGGITVKGSGGLLGIGSGSTSLTPEQLRKNPKALDAALEKAYYTPKNERYVAQKRSYDPEDPSTWRS